MSDIRCPYCKTFKELEAERDMLRAALLDAADEVSHWGAYATSYFQDKHDLPGCVATIKAKANRSQGNE